MLATHRVQDAFGLARFRFDENANRVIPVLQNGHNPTPGETKAEGVTGPTTVLVIREGQIYFEGTAEELLKTSDDYLKTFLASAE